MSFNPCPGPAQLRGCVVGVATGALAVAAHGAAGGGYPTSAGTALLLLTTLVTGWVSGSVVTGARGRLANRAVAPGLGIFVPLVSGQFIGHWALAGLTGHHTGTGSAVGESSTGGPLSAAMFATHLLAVLLCTLMITAAERLYRAASAALRVLLAPVHRFPPAPRVCIAAIVATPRNHAPNGASGPRAPPRRVLGDVPTSFGEKVFRPCPTGFPHLFAAV
ncbi:hypothetical protein [Nocardia flavorosea]|uniref:Uncharacterized protein n=1 Tax=Nocardia flavorosea TaxID=53429 RepID=A0A846YBP7_9NOCA|nr:hypothetical protein [Nocardia flavorosea]NKY56277.1 hypothetical protein [Nocardia flavorosea]